MLAEASDRSNKKAPEGAFYWRVALLNLGLGAQFVHVLLDDLLGQTLADLRLGFFQRRDLQIAHFFELDDVVAEVGLDRFLGVGAGLERSEGVGEGLHEGRRGGPTEVAATFL